MTPMPPSIDPDALARAIEGACLDREGRDLSPLSQQPNDVLIGMVASALTELRRRAGLRPYPSKQTTPAPSAASKQARPIRTFASETHPED